ncbi:MAG: sporulation protein YunB [Clostridia bacterium]|nr:sporulation protein YunB [Clostridia bacterium]
MQIDLGAVRRQVFRRLKRRPFVPVLVTVFVLLALFLRVQGNIRPVATKMAVSAVSNWATDVVNAAVEAEVVAEGLAYSSLINFEKMADGSVSAVYTDIAKLNRLKTEVTAVVLERIANCEPGEIAIPLGNILETELLAGRGPKLRIRIIPLGSVHTEVENRFESAGINQTRHRILLRVTAKMTVLIAGYAAPASVSTEVCVAETVIVGSVPENYTVITDGEVFDKYNDFLID